MRLKLGPYKIGDTILLKCVASGGKTMIDLSHDYLDMTLQYYFMMANKFNEVYEYCRCFDQNTNITLNKSFVYV